MALGVGMRPAVNVSDNGPNVSYCISFNCIIYPFSAAVSNHHVFDVNYFSMTISLLTKI